MTDNAMQTEDRSNNTESLVRAAMNGDLRAFDRLIERHYAVVYSISYAHLKHREAAEDLTQEVFLRAHLFLHQLRDPVRFSAWLGRMARNFALQWLRTGQRTSRLAILIPFGEEHVEMADTRTPDALTQMVLDEEQQAVRQAIDDLPGDLREIILLHHLGKLTLSEIAGHQEVHVSTVSRKHEQALRKLRGVFEPVIQASVKSLAPSRRVTARTAGVMAAVAALSSTARASLVALAVQTGGAATGAPLASAGYSSAFVSLLKSIPFVTKTGGTVAMSLKVTTVTVAATACLVGGVYWTCQGNAGTGSSNADRGPTAIVTAAEQNTQSVLNTSAITDPKTRSVVEQIVGTLGKIREYAATVRNASTVPNGNLSMTEQFWYKPPYVLVVQTNTEHPVATVRGNTSYLYWDGNSLVMHVKPGPGALQAFTEMFGRNGRMPQDQVQRLAAQSASPKAYRYDLRKLRAAGVPTQFFVEWVANPFGDCDLSSIRLEGETADTWSLSAMFDTGTGKHKGLLRIGKDNCVVRSVDFDPTARASKNTVTIQDVRINPSPGIQDTVFKYVAPAGVTVTEHTDEYIRLQSRQKPPTQ